MPLTNINSDWMSFSEFHSDRAYRSFRKGCNRNVALKWHRKNLGKRLHFEDRTTCRIHPIPLIWVPMELPFYALFKNKGGCCDKQILIFTPTLLLPISVVPWGGAAFNATVFYRGAADQHSRYMMKGFMSLAQSFQSCDIMCTYYYPLMWYSTARSGSPQDALHLH